MGTFKSFTLVMLIGIAAVGLTISSARAAVVWDPTGVSVQNINVGGTLYDVAFGDGTCLVLFSPCNADGNFAFTTLADASTAALALQSQAFHNDGVGNFGTDPELINGCGDIFICDIIIPYQAFTGSQLVLAVRIRNGSLDDGLTCGNFGDCFIAASDTTNFADFAPSSNIFTYGVFTISTPTVIPLPAALPLFLTGLAGLGLMRRRMRRA